MAQQVQVHSRVGKLNLPAAPPLKDDNYFQFRSIIENQIKCNGLEATLGPTQPDGTPPAPEHQQLALGLLYSSLNTNDFSLVHRCNSITQALDILRTSRHGNPSAHVVAVAAELLTKRITEGQSALAFCSELRKLSNMCKEADLPIPDLLLAVIAVVAAQHTPKYQAVCNTMLTGIVPLTLDYVQSTLKAVEVSEALQHVPSALTASGAGTSTQAGGSSATAPQTDAVAALSKKVNDLSSKLGRFSGSGNNQRSRQQQQQFQSGGRSQQYGPRQQQQYGPLRTQYQHQRKTQFNCHNCGGFGHAYGDCRKPCQKCNRYGHSSHQCGTRGNFGRGNMAHGFDHREDDFVTGHSFMHAGMRMPPMPPADPFMSSMPSPFMPPIDPMLSPAPFTTGAVGQDGSTFASRRGPSRTSKWEWILDSGATHHMTACKEYLFDYVADTRALVQVATNLMLPRAGYGTIRFRTTINGVEHVREVRNVWHVPGLTVSLLSMQQLKRAGCWHVSGKSGDLTEYLFDRNDVLFLECPEKHGLNVPAFRVSINADHVGTQKTYATDSADPAQPATATGICTYSSAAYASDPQTAALWHQRLAHANFQSLYHMTKRGLVKGIDLHYSAFKPLHNKTCEVCVMAKHQRSPSLPRPERADTVMQTLHSDVCVYPEPSIEGGKYAVTLLDEYTAYCEVIVLRHKHEVSNALKGAISRWANITNHKCKTLFTDRGGEYIGDDFKLWCAQKGITHDKSVPRTPKQNGKAERLNQTLNNHVRAMLLHYNLPKCLWAHALLYAASIHNVVLKKRLQVTPHQAFHHRVPSVHNFRTFGCKVFARLPETQRDKLDPKSEIGIYLGPVHDGPGHKVLVYQPHANRKFPYAVHIFRDIVTFENLTDSCGVQDSSALRWGGNIPLPSAAHRPGNRDNNQQPHDEPMSGTLESGGNKPLTLPQLQHLLLAQRAHTNTGTPSTTVTHDGGNTLVSAQNSGSGHNGPVTQRPVTQQMLRPAVATEPPTAPPDQTNTKRYAAVFSATGNLPAGTSSPQLSHAASATDNKRTKISHPSGPVPFLHLSVAAPPPGPLPTLADVHKYALPRTVQEALTSPYAKFWLTALNDELASLHKNNTWQLVSRPANTKVIPCKWIFKIKTDADGNPTRFKCRLVAGGHKQEEGIDYHETYAPVSRHATLRTFLSVAAHRGWEVHQLDIKTAFLHGDIDTDVYMSQPPGFVEGTGLVCKLTKCLYGLKQAPRAWYMKQSEALRTLGFRPVSADSSFWVQGTTAIAYLPKVSSDSAFLTSVVDDMLVSSPDSARTKRQIAAILHRFEGTHSGIAHLYVGMKLTWYPNNHSVLLTQQAHVQELLHKFEPLHHDWSPRQLPAVDTIKLTATGVIDAKSDKSRAQSPLLDVTRYPYRSLVGGFNYLACTTRPDIAYITNQLSRYCNAPTVAHWEVGINVLRYLAGTQTLGIMLGHSDVPALAYVDSSHGTGTPDGKSVAGHIILVHGGPVSWSSHTLALTCTSSTESEYRAMSDCAKDVLWLTKVLREFAVPHRPFTIKGDCKGAMDAVNHHSTTKHTKHIELHLDFMKERVTLGDLKFVHIPGRFNPADMLTKALPRGLFGLFRDMIGMKH